MRLTKQRCDPTSLSSLNTLFRCQGPPWPTSKSYGIRIHYYWQSGFYLAAGFKRHLQPMSHRASGHRTDNLGSEAGRIAMGSKDSSMSPVRSIVLCSPGRLMVSVVTSVHDSRFGRERTDLCLVTNYYRNEKIN